MYSCCGELDEHDHIFEYFFRLLDLELLLIENKEISNK